MASSLVIDNLGGAYSTSFRYLLGFVILFLLKTPESGVKASPLLDNAPFERFEELHRDFLVRWAVDFEAAVIKFSVSARSRGYIGFGISYTGDMTGADMIVGGIQKDGTPYFSDRHATGRFEPQVDYQQDWELLSSKREGEWINLEFSRPLETCDLQHDISIVADTLNMIWAIGDSNDLTRHKLRGNRQVNFLDAPQDEIDTSSMKFMDLTLTVDIPSDKDTFYWCAKLRSPIFYRKSHMIGFEAILDSPEAQKHTHHLQIFRYSLPLGAEEPEFDKLDELATQPGFECHANFSEPPPDVKLEGGSFFVWAKGGSKLFMPDHVGFPIGENPGISEYFGIQIHFDNPDLDRGQQVTTGVRIFYTENVRQYDADLMYVGRKHGTSILVPPGVKDFVISGHCSSECTKQKIPDSVDGDGSISVFNILLHSHLSGRKIKLRHFRDGEELPWAANDDHYNFNYQQSRPLRNELKVKGGDHLTIECTYDTTWTKPPSAVIGGLSTRMEMCDAFLYYYPKVSGLGCSSYPDLYPILNKFGIENITKSYPQSDYPTVTAPKSLANLGYLDVLNSRVKWTPQFLKEIQHDLSYADQLTSCHAGPVNYPKVSQVYQPSSKCPNSGSLSSNINSKQSSIILYVALAAVLRLVFLPHLPSF